MVGIPRCVKPIGAHGFAVRVKDAAAFALALQWHPEWPFRENPDSVTLFRAFAAGRVCPVSAEAAD